MHDNFNEFSAI